MKIPNMGEYQENTKTKTWDNDPRKITFIFSKFNKMHTESILMYPKHALNLAKSKPKKRNTIDGGCKPLSITGLAIHFATMKYIGARRMDSKPGLTPGQIKSYKKLVLINDYKRDPDFMGI